MDQILNLLTLTPEEKEAFRAASQLPQRFAPDEAGLGPEDYVQAQVIFGNPSVSLLKGSSALRWLQTRSAGADPYGNPGVLPILLDKTAPQSFRSAALFSKAAFGTSSL